MKSSKRYSRLLVTTEPFPDESLWGFLLRLCEINGYRRLRWLTKLVGYSKSRTVANNNSLRILSQLSGISAEQLRTFSYAEVRKVREIRRLIHYCRFGTTLIRRHWLDLKKARVCPQCLAESAHIRAIWDVKFVSACAKHGLAILEQCPHCKRSLSWSRNTIAFCNCGLDLRLAKTAPVHGPELVLNQLIYGAAKQDTPTITNSYGLPMDSLVPLGLSDLLNFLTIAGSIAHIGNGQQDPTARILSLSDAKELVTNAAECITDWPKNFHTILQSLHEQRRSVKTFSLSKELTNLTRWKLSRVIRKSKFEFLRDALTDYFYQNWDGSQARTSFLVPSVRRVQTQYLTRHDVTQMFGSHPHTVNRLFRDGILEGNATWRGHNKVHLITRTSATALQELLSRHTSTERAAMTLGVTERTLWLLQKCGLLQSRTNPVHSHTWLFAKQEIEMLLSSLDAQVRQPNPESRCVRVAFRDALRRTRIPIGNFIRYIQNGLIRPIAVDNKRIGLQKFLFKRDDLMELKKTVNTKSSGRGWSGKIPWRTAQFRLAISQKSYSNNTST